MRNRAFVICGLAFIELRSPKYGTHFTVIDASDLPVADSIPGSWSLSWAKSTLSFYCQAQVPKSLGLGTSCIGLHRLIADAVKGVDVDHINHNTLDNRKSNLRLVCRSENAQNRVRPGANNRTGVIGVHWEPDRHKYRAELTIKGRKVRIGRFDSLEEARSAVSQARAWLMPGSQEAYMRQRVKEGPNNAT